MARDDRRGSEYGAGASGPSSASLKISFREFVVLSALLVSLTALSIDIMLPALPRIGADFGIAGANDQQLVVTAYFLGLASGQLFYGPLSDHYGRKRMLLIGLCIYLVGALGAVTVGSFQHLLWARLIQGFGGAASRVLAVAIVRDMFAGRSMARVMSIVMMVFIIVPVFAPTVGQGIAQVGSWRWIFYFLIIVALIDIVWSTLRLPETRTLKGGAAPLGYMQAVKATLMSRATVGYSLAAGFLFGCLASYVASAQQVFVDVFHLGERFPMAFGLIASLLAAASFTNSRLVMRYGMRRVSHSALVWFVVLSALLVLSTLKGTPPLLLFGALLAGAFYGFGLMMSNFNAIAMHPVGHVAGTASSLSGFYTTSAGAVLGWQVARHFDGTARPLALGFLVLGLLTAAAVVWTEGRKGLFRGE